MRGQGAPCQDDFGSGRPPYQTHQAGRSADPGACANGYFRLAEARLLLGNPQVASPAQLTTAARCVTVDRGNRDGRSTVEKLERAEPPGGIAGGGLPFDQVHDVAQIGMFEPVPLHG